MILGGGWGQCWQKYAYGAVWCQNKEKHLLPARLQACCLEDLQQHCARQRPLTQQQSQNNGAVWTCLPLPAAPTLKTPCASFSSAFSHSCGTVSVHSVCIGHVYTVSGCTACKSAELVPSSLNSCSLFPYTVYSSRVHSLWLHCMQVG